MKQRDEQSVAIRETLAGLGMALYVIQEIESYLAQATLLGLTARQRKKRKTFEDFWAARDKMTFGQLVEHFKEDWIVDSNFEESLDWFVSERNTLVHRVLVTDDFSLRSEKDREELNQRIVKFMDIAAFMKHVFHGGYLLSNEFLVDWGNKRSKVKVFLKTPEEWEDDIVLFRDIATWRWPT